jgi:hypothetical protein
MASILKVDALQGITSAGDITVTSEGGAATQSLQQGLAKAWVYANGNAGLLDSINIASSTDHGTGDYSYALNNAFSSTNYVHNATSSTTAQGRIATRNSGRATTSVIAVETAQSTALNDTVNGSSVHGDLA